MPEPTARRTWHWPTPEGWAWIVFLTGLAAIYNGWQGAALMGGFFAAVMLLGYWMRI